MRHLRIGSRGSILAMWQANFIRRRLAEEMNVQAEVVVLKTAGDRFQEKQVGQIGMKGVFIKELEDALLAGRVDLAVHSMKDVPTEVPPALAFPAVTCREEARDCLVSRSGARLNELPAGARVGTSSLRRQSQLRHYRPNLDLCDLRGNVDTRLAKLARGDYDAIVLAKAGLDRLGLSGRITEVLAPEIMLPAVGQGALGIEARAADGEGIELLARLDDAQTRVEVTAERTLLSELHGGCLVPLGAWGCLEEGQLVLEACVSSPDGTDFLRRRATGPSENPEDIGRRLAAILLEAGAGRILQLAGRIMAGGSS